MPASAWYRELVSGRSRGAGASLLRGGLGLVAKVYGAVVRSKNRRYDSGRAQAQKVAAPVISVGNLTVGGTGKTPFVCWLAEWFQQRAAHVTLISRGYGAKRGEPNDESLELAARLPGVPHLQNPDRVAAAQAALANAERETLTSHVLILDDAFQHRRIARDLDVVLLDALQPFGFEHLLPRGLLREPPESLGRAQVVALSRADAISPAEREQIRQRVARLAPAALWLELVQRPRGFLSSTGERLELAALQNRPLAAFCGIGNPAGFRHTLAACGMQVARLREFPDHFAYPPAALAELEQWAEQQTDCVALICTHKDLVKIPRAALGKLPLWALAVEVQVTHGQQELEARLGPLIGQ